MKHNELTATKSINRKHDAKAIGGMVFILNGYGKLKPINDIGIKTWGKIDFLVNHKGYKLVRIDSIPRL